MLEQDIHQILIELAKKIEEHYKDSEHPVEVLAVCKAETPSQIRGEPAFVKYYFIIPEIEPPERIGELLGTTAKLQLRRIYVTPLPATLEELKNLSYLNITKCIYKKDLNT